MITRTGGRNGEEKSRRTLEKQKKPGRVRQEKRKLLPLKISGQ